MEVPLHQRDAMLASYGSRDGAMHALSVLAGSPLSDLLREQFIEDTLPGSPQAKRAWTQHNMIADVSERLDAITIPVSVVVGDRDQVEREETLRTVFVSLIPHASFHVLRGIGHVSLLEAPHEVADICVQLLARVSRATAEDRTHLVSTTRRPVAVIIPPAAT
jgi:pimeloyl-ACP methyl ester carboxylesterase